MNKAHKNPPYEKRIRELLAQYKKLFAGEYKLFLQAMPEKRKLLLNEETGALKDSHVLERPLFDMPETLYYTFLKGLSEEHLKLWQSDGGQLWFAKTFPEFRIPEKL